MRLTSISLEDFRCFSRKAWRFAPHFNLLIGENGTGKTTALEAIACALGAWLKQFPDVKERPLSDDDYRVHSVLKGTQLDEQKQKRVRIEAKAIVNDEEVGWFRVKVRGQRLSALPRITDQLTPLAKHSSDLVIESRDVTLPLISFYGTGRLWNVPNAQRPKLRKGRGETNRLEGYELAVDPRTSPDLLIEWLTRQEWIAFQKGTQNPVLNVVKKAIVNCLSRCLDLRYDAAHQAIMLSFKDGEYQNFARLSDGQRNVMAMVADMAIKAATLNPHLGAEVLEQTPGIVLIDELDLHLHPRWQRRIIADLKRTFPKIQFIATTHSPFLIQALEPGELIDLQQDEDGKKAEYSDQSIEDITENVMGVDLPQKSLRYLEMMEVAKEYYTLLRSPNADKLRLAELERELDEKTLPFSDDPAFHALLELERETQAGRG